MKSFQNYKKRGGFLKSKYFLIVLFGVLIFFSFKMFDFASRARVAYKNKELAENNLNILLQSKEKLESEINNLKTEKGVEQNIREKFGFAKEGEHLIMVVEDKKQEDNTRKEKTESSWSFFKNWLE